MPMEQENRAKLVVQALEPGGYRWQFCSTPENAEPLGTGDLAALASCCEGVELLNVTLLLPALRAPLRLIELGRRERRYARRTVPYRLEDQLLEDVDALHFAIGRPEDGHTRVTIVGREYLQEQLDCLAGIGVFPNCCLVEQALLPPDPPCLAYFDGHTLLMRDGAEAVIHAVDTLALPLALAELKGSDDEQESLCCLLEAGSDAGPLHEAAEAVGLNLDCQPICLLSRASALNERQQLDLLQGVFAPRIDWPLQWRRWRPAMAVVLAALVLHSLVSALQLVQLRSHDRQLRGEVEAVYRELFPDGVLVNARSQMNTQLKRLRNTGGGDGFLQHFYPLGELLAAQPGLKLHSLRFDGRSGDIRLDVSLPNHQAVEALRSALAETLQSANLQSSTVSGGAVRARFAVR